ncbi:ankyrin repeat-containing domain protein [Trichoderma velutinum]
MGRRDRLKERLSKVFGSATSNETDTADPKGHQLRRRQVGSSGLNDPPDGVTGLDKSPEHFKGRLIQDTPIRELWNVAYEKLREEDGTLIAGYEAKLTGSVTAGVGQSLSSKQNRREWMQAILSSKMDEINKNKSKLESGNFTTQAKDAMQLLLKTINSAKDYIGNAASANPYTSIAWAGISFLLPLLMNMSEEEAALAKGLEYTASLIVQSRMREELYFECYESGTHNHERFRQSHTQYKTALERLYIYILRFQATACYHYSKSSALRHGLDAVKWKDWAPLVDEVREQERNFAAVEELWRDIQRYTEHLTTVKTFSEMNAKLSAIEDQEFADLLRWLCDVDPSSMYNTGLDRHEAGTCEWLIKDSEEFKTWETSDGSLLWLHGKAGSGKSILSSSVIKHLRNQYASEPSTVVSYFYFSFSDPEKQKVDIMLASLTKQICSRQTQKSQLMERLKQYKIKSERPDTETLEAILIASASEFTKLYIVIDALDECPLFNEQRGMLLKSLRRLLAIAPNKFHFFLTSRSEPDIDDKIRPILTSTNKNEIDLLARQQIINRDINHYIDSQLNGDEYKNWPKSIKDEARESLVEKADCMFQYVRLQLEALRSLSSESGIRKALRDLPTGLDATYNRVLESIPPRFQERVIHSLKWLAFSREVFCIEELAEIFTIRPHDDIPFDEKERPFSPTDILKYFSGLIIVQEDNSSEVDFSEDSFSEDTQSTQTQIRLVHFSLKEYLVSRRITEGATLAFSLTEVDAHLSIVRSCLVYMNHLNYWIAGQTTEDLDSGTVNKLYPLAKYAARYWMGHLEEIPRMSWPPDIVRDTMSALAVHSQSLLTLLILCGGKKRNTMKPYCYTAERGHFQLTKMLIYQNSGANKYVTREELDDALQRIAFKGNADMMQVFLEAGADVNAQCGKWGSALHAAAEGGRLDCLKLLVSHGANVNSLSYNIWGECLLTCIPRYATDCLQFLLDSGADIDMQGRYYTTALHKAVRNGDDASFDLLLDRGANVNVLDDKGTPLQAACKLQPLSWSLLKTRNIARYVKKLLESGADPNLRDGKNSTALQLACDNRGLFPNHRVAMEIVQLLVQNRPVEKGTIIQGFVVKEAGIDEGYLIWGNGDQEWTKERPVLKSAVEILKLLLEKGGITEEPLALHMASLRRDEERVRWLLDQGADVSKKVKNSFLEFGTPLHAVLTFIINDEGEVRWPYISTKIPRSKKSLSEETIPIVQLLIGKGAQVNDIGGKRGTALQAACSNEAFDVDMVRFLLEHGADVNAEGGEYGTALMAACLNEAFDVDTVRLLLEHGADVNAEGGENRRTALGVACRFRDLELVRLLLEYGANIHQQDDAAWIAAAWRSPDYDQGIEVLQLLFDHAADMDVNHVDKENGTALNCMLNAWYDEKRRQTLHEKLCWLLEHGADVNVEGGKYGFALQTACARKSEIRGIIDVNAASRTTKFLLEKCPDINVNAQGGIFGSALQAAAFSGQTESVRLLLDRGADINARSGKCGSALNAAIFSGYWDIVEILLEAGATPDHRLRQQPDEEWLQRVGKEWLQETEDYWRKHKTKEYIRCAIARYRKFWEVESGSASGAE